MPVINAYAKINLFLEVLSKREDGYHELESVMQSISLCDTVSIEKAEKDGFYISDPALDNADNIVLKAKQAFFDRTGIPYTELDIKVEKRIPVAAGLAGGSTDCAAVLKGMNAIFGEPLNEEELCALGKTLGADVPFCILGGTRLARGIGEKLEELTPLADIPMVVAIGKGRISTKEAFAKIDGYTERNIRSADETATALDSGSVDAIARTLYNVFENVSSYEQGIKTVMKDSGAKAALMSGSGPSVFGIFECEEDAQNAKRELIQNGFEAHFCRPTRA